MTLFDISDAIRKLVDDTVADGELIPEQLDELDRLTGDLDAKVDSYCTLIAEWEAEAEARLLQVERLKAGVRTRLNNVERLKDNLKFNLEKLGAKNHNTALFSCRIQSSGPSCVCSVKPEDLPSDLKRVKIVSTPDNAKAIAIFKETGKAPEGFQITVGSHLRIK